ncbi:MAG: hypothetical protein ACAH12_03510 [Methylophilaceae bacterium]
MDNEIKERLKLLEALYRGLASEHLAVQSVLRGITAVISVSPSAKKEVSSLAYGYASVYMQAAGQDEDFQKDVNEEIDSLLK